MGEYTNDFMMAVVVSSAAFIGLTPIVIGQISKSGIKRIWKKALVSFLALSVLFGVLSIIFASCWFLGSESLVVEKTLFVRFILQMFASEIVICEVVMFGFWFGLFGEVEPSKPATPPKRSQK